MTRTILPGRNVRILLKTSFIANLIFFVICVTALVLIALLGALLILEGNTSNPIAEACGLIIGVILLVFAVAALVVSVIFGIAPLSYYLAMTRGSRPWCVVGLVSDLVFAGLSALSGVKAGWAGLFWGAAFLLLSTVPALIALVRWEK